MIRRRMNESRRAAIRCSRPFRRHTKVTMEADQFPRIAVRFAKHLETITILKRLHSMCIAFFCRAITIAGRGAGRYNPGPQRYKPPLPGLGSAHGHPDPGRLPAAGK